jgi:hypothetical protein
MQAQSRRIWSTRVTFYVMLTGVGRRVYQLVCATALLLRCLDGFGTNSINPSSHVVRCSACHCGIGDTTTLMQLRSDNARVRQVGRTGECQKGHRCACNSQITSHFRRNRVRVEALPKGGYVTTLHLLSAESSHSWGTERGIPSIDPHSLQKLSLPKLPAWTLIRGSVSSRMSPRQPK